MPRVKLSPDTTRMLRHLIATIAYRAGMSMRDAPSGFEETRLIEDGMSAGELVLHMTNVLALAVATVADSERVRYQPVGWEGEVARFYALLLDLDQRLSAGVEMEEGMDLKMVQGPFADAFSHIGQLNMMRRKAGAPIPGISYVKANVQAGCVALTDQPA